MSRNVGRIVFGIVLAVVLIGAGIGLYDAGVAQGVAEAARVAAPDAAVAAPYPYYAYAPSARPWGFGFLFPLFFGFVFFFLFFGLLRFLFWGPRRGWGGRHGYDGQNVPQRFEEWHRRLHEPTTEQA